MALTVRGQHQEGVNEARNWILREWTREQTQCLVRIVNQEVQRLREANPERKEGNNIPWKQIARDHKDQLEDRSPVSRFHNQSASTIHKVVIHVILVFVSHCMDGH